MKLLVAGSRSIVDNELVSRCIKNSGFNITEIVSGAANGVDFGGEVYAAKHNIPVKWFPAQWKLHGKKAGHIRNAEMAEYCDCAVIVWDGKSLAV